MSAAVVDRVEPALVLRSMHSAVDDLLAVDWTAGSDEELLEAFRSLEALRRRLAAVDHALILQASKRFGRHFSLNANYTFSKAIDDVTDFNSDFERQYQLNARLGQFVALVEDGRMHQPSAQVAHCLAELCNPRLNPTAGRTIAISQEEVGRLSGMSRQIANRALHELQAAGLLAVSYGAIDVFDVEGLRRFSPSH